MSDREDFANLLYAFMERERRSARDLSVLTGIAERTIENWRDGTVARPRNRDQVLLLATRLPLNTEDASRLLIAAGQLPLAELIAQARGAGDEKLLALLLSWVAREPDMPASPAHVGQAEAERFERKYRVVVGGELERFEIFGVPEVDAKARRQRISVAYVNPEVEALAARSTWLDAEGQRHARRMPRSTPSRRALNEDLDYQTSADHGLSLSGPVNRMLAAAPRIVVSGEAGSGKTTLAQWIALRSANRDFPSELADWNGTVPFFIRLRAIKSGPDGPRGFPTPEEFPDLVAQGMAGKPPNNWVIDQLDAGRAVVIVDGVDELPQAQRELMLAALIRLVRLYPDARYIITSRPLRVKEEPWEEWETWLDEQQFVRARLQDMSRAAIETFVDHWHAAMLDACPLHEQDEVRRMPAALKGLLHQRRALFRLATNPLLCAMICALHYDRRDNLPGERVELYRACVEMLILRDSGRKIVLDDEFPRLKPVQQQRLIQEFAYTLTRSGALDMARDDVDKTFDYRLRLMDVPAETTGAKVCTLFTRRIRLLHEPVAGRVEFVHRTFQEYLAARAAREANEIDELLNHADDDQWRETIILAAGMTDAQQSDRLLGGLLAGVEALSSMKSSGSPTNPRRARTKPSTSDEAQVRRIRRLTLAVACLETCVERSPEIAAAILQRAQTLFPPKDDDEAKLLAAAGPKVIPLLKDRPWYSQREAVACVLALTLIGGEEALVALVEYAEDESDAIARALGQAWDSFDRVIFARQVLRHRRQLVVASHPSLEGLEELANLTELSLTGMRVTDLTALQGLPQLTKLYLSTMEVTDLTMLQKLPQLTTLYLSAMEVTDLTMLQKLPRLTALHLGAMEVTDLTMLQKLPQLTSLSLIDMEVTDLTMLQKLPQLTSLSLIDMEVTDLTVLQKLPQLTTLHLRGTRVTDLTVLQQLPQLTTLHLRGKQIADLTPLQGLPQLTRLHLSGKRMPDLKPLQSLSQLTELNLSGRLIADLAPLRALSQLTRLNLSGRLVRDLTSLQLLPQLTTLDISHTAVTDLTPIQYLTNLTELNLNHTPVSDLTPLQRLTNLRRLHLRGTQVRDLRPLEGLRNLKLNDARADDDP